MSRDAVHSAAGLKLRYRIDVALLSPQLRGRCVTLDRDAGTDAFIAAAMRGRSGRVRTRAHRLLRRFASDFDVNGWLDMYTLFVASTAQFRSLLGPRTVPRLLDVGAGAGYVTEQLAPLAERIVTTELSPPMVRGLRRRGFACHAVDVTETSLRADADAAASSRRGPGPSVEPCFDLVSCLNVLDRTARPQRLLRRLRDLVAPGGRLLIGLALPYEPFFYVGAQTPEPRERLACGKLPWERAVNVLVEREFEPLGFCVTALARAPYLSFGDTRRAVYELDDVLLVLEKQ